MTLITGDERRRRWSDADRARILAEIEVPGAVVAEVARRAVWRDNQGENGASIWMRSGDRAF
jgi:transposase-like protein